MVQRKIAVWVVKKPDIFGLFAGDIFFVYTLWYARLDSNQRPLESELSGRQAGKPCRARVWLVLHKFPPFWRKTSEALSDRASEVFCGSSQIVVCAADTATPVFIILTTSLSVPSLYGTKREVSTIQTCQKSAFHVRFACAIMPLSTVR